MSVSILTVLATLPSGAVSQPLTFDELSRYLTETYNTQAEIERNRRHALRDELYQDGGVQHMRSLIDRVFKDPDIREKRKQFVEIARFTNAIKRIVGEMSVVYAEPAKRLVSDGNDNYQSVLDAVRMDETMLQVSRLLNLHRALLVGFRVRQLPDGTREPVLDIASPANVRAVMHPNDNSMVVGWLIKASCKPVRPMLDVPAWTLWTTHESVSLRESLSVIASSYQEHRLGVLPWVPITLGPTGSGFWPGSEGEDLVAAHLALWLTNVLLLKEEKSATKQTIYAGDGTNVGRGQSADTEVPTELADGQSATTVDMSMDLSLFRDTADHVLNHTGLNYGLSPAMIQHQGVQSAQARELMRIPLRELRNQQRIPLRRFERQLAIVMAAVLGVDLPALVFDPADWRMEFSESETPLDPLSEQNLFEKRRASGLDNTLAMLQRLRPGISIEQAVTELQANIAIETSRNIMMRPLEAISGSLGAELPSGQVKVAETVDVAAPPTSIGNTPAKSPSLSAVATPTANA